MGVVIESAPASFTPANLHRSRSNVSLIVIHADPRSAAQARDAYAADPAHAPHYYIAATGDVTQLAPEKKITQHSGNATWQKRRRNIDRISIGIALEQRSEDNYSDEQLVALHNLLDAIEKRYGLGDSAIVRWKPGEGHGSGQVVPFLPPPPPLIVHDDGAVLGVLGVDDDVSAGQRFWGRLEDEAAQQRGGGFKVTRAFDLYAAKFDLGAPVAPNDSTPINVNGSLYNVQTFARDTICNEGRNWGAVQSLNSLLGDEMSMPESGLARALLEASYAVSLKTSASKVALKGNQNFHPDWTFHYVAAREHLGPALSGNYVTDDGQYAVQVFAGDTLYTPMTDQANFQRLSQATPDQPVYAQMWAETYKICGAPYDPNAPFQQRAAQDDLGTPLTGVHQVDFEGTSYQVQVFALDTLYAGPDGEIKRQSTLPKPSEVGSWQPTPVAAPTVANTSSRSQLTISSGTPSADPHWPPPPTFPCLPSQSARQQAFGAFSYVPIGGGNIRITDGWQAEHIIPVTIPQLAHVAGAPGNCTIQFHKRAADQLRAMWAAWEAAGLLNRVINWQGSFVPRFIRGSNSQLSNHAFGTAFDINATWNPWYGVPALLGKQGCVRELVQIANQHGFFWGGHFQYGKGLSDGMHFEWAVQM